jgi:2-dehydropantoate 2-reductase
VFVRQRDMAYLAAPTFGQRNRAKTRSYFGQIFADPQSSYTTSMLRDIEAGNRTEGDHIIGFALERARAAGLDASLLEIAYTHVQAYDNRRAAGRLAARPVSGS